MEESNTIAGDVIAATELPKENKGLSKKTKLVFVSLALIFVVAGGLLVILILTRRDTSEEYIQIARNLIQKIEESGENQIIYFYEDLKKLDPDFGMSPYGREISKTAHIYYQNGNPTTCFSDGEHILTRGSFENKFTILDKRADCDDVTSVGDPEKIDYFIYYYSKKGYALEKENIKKINERYFKIKTDKATIYASLSVSDHKIIINDDIGDKPTIENADDAIEAVSYYLNNIGDSGIGAKHQANHIEIMTSNTGEKYIHIRSNEHYGSSLKLLNNISEYLVERNCIDIIITMNLIVEEKGQIYNSFIIRSIIKDGKFELQTLVNNEK